MTMPWIPLTKHLSKISRTAQPDQDQLGLANGKGTPGHSWPSTREELCLQLQLLLGIIAEAVVVKGLHRDANVSLNLLRYGCRQD